MAERWMCYRPGVRGLGVEDEHLVNVSTTTFGSEPVEDRFEVGSVEGVVLRQVRLRLVES